jgi:hypothetical protein
MYSLKIHWSCFRFLQAPAVKAVATNPKESDAKDWAGFAWVISRSIDVRLVYTVGHVFLQDPLESFKNFSSPANKAVQRGLMPNIGLDLVAFSHLEKPWSAFSIHCGPCVPLESDLGFSKPQLSKLLLQVQRSLMSKIGLDLVAFSHFGKPWSALSVHSGPFVPLESFWGVSQAPAIQIVATSPKKPVAKDWAWFGWV